ncbi:MAG: peptidylprolyl isomerase [Myxococcales bacterium]|nr:peptidylprolyl isomerase [Myxococcales bacterium]MCB9521640.1 peptidylprolyl isomerase [Myxococcales bacterium]MCB9531602.1 peptidylprolyl isomerase [Myxococcales bacterium]MCB9532746.1 peptidylprolyl isomerase [Myxococcales bacterium]
MKIENNKAVAVHYRLQDADGILLDTSRGGDPLWYLHGHGQLVRGVERGLDGHAVGDKFELVVSAEDGYGTADPRLDGAFPMSAFPASARKNLRVGEEFQAPDPRDSKKKVVYRVVDLVGEHVHASANHPLADVDLHFDLEVVEVRDATPEEIAHGHVHVHGHHHH